jgi:hypothetical protein
VTRYVVSLQWRATLCDARCMGNRLNDEHGCLRVSG